MSRPHADNLPCLDVRRIDFALGAQRQRYGNGVLSVDGESVRIHGADIVIGIERTPCNYGGSRPWFLCPSCGDRRAVLYPTGSALGCRRCLRLGRRSDVETKEARLWRKLRNLLARLEARDELDEILARTARAPVLGLAIERPKGMRTETYTRLRLEVAETWLAIATEVTRQYRKRS